MTYGFKYLLLAFLLVGNVSVSAGQIYKCVIKGKTVFTDTPCGGEVVELSPMNTMRAFDTSNNFVAEDYRRAYSSDEWLRNIGGYREALRISKMYGAPIFIYFQADWCRYCRKLESELLYKQDAKEHLATWIKVKISPEDSPEDHAFFKQMGGTGYPTVLTQKAYDATPKKTKLMAKQDGGWRTQNAEEFALHLQQRMK